ncbi:MAG: LytTR family DNA-binding domain-containing protein [Ignavibacteriae bacterium]|nr:LytTR family DNA-binding domain-containing protein [Ignavibacteriota bacterium]
MTNNPKNIRALVVDDELLARERIKELMSLDPALDLVGECEDGVTAIEEVKRLQPDLLFLDIQMPEVDGFGVLKALKPKHMPVVIFTTAYNQYAIRAFEARALDYLLKPIEEKRFRQSVERAKEMLAVKNTQRDNSALINFLHELKNEQRSGQRFLVKKGGRIFPVHEKDIDWVEAEGEYVRLHVKGTSYLLHEKISSIETRLSSSRFVRVHRSAIVNIDQIRELEPSFHRDYTITLLNGARISVSRSHTESLFKLLDAR